MYVFKIPKYAASGHAILASEYKILKLSGMLLIIRATDNNYEERNGIKQPTSYKAVWHYGNGDSVYFDSSL